MSHSEGEHRVLALHDEQLIVSKQAVPRATVRVGTVTRSEDRLVEQALTHERVEIERVPINSFVDAAPPVRTEGDVTILPVLEEVVVVQRRLLLKEEVHVRRVRLTEQHVETVSVRTQDAIVTRTPIAGPAHAAASDRPHHQPPSPSISHEKSDRHD